MVELDRIIEQQRRNLRELETLRDAISDAEVALHARIQEPSHEEFTAAAVILGKVMQPTRSRA
jgi:hypothetical protein